MNTELEPSDDENPPQQQEGMMAFWDHVEELRWTLIKCLAAFFIAAIIVGVISVLFADILQWPLQRAFDMLGTPDRQITLRTEGPSSVFGFLIQLIFFGGFALSLPFMLYFVVRFVAPGLTEAEKSVLRPVCASIIGLFVLGMMTAFFLILPFYMYVTLMLEAKYNFVALWTPTKYYGAVVWMSLGLGLLFQTPLIIILLIYLGIVDVQQLRRTRQYAMFIILIIAALLTPGGDPITLAVTSLPLYVLYEAALFVGGKLRTRKEIADAKAQEEWDREYSDD